MSKANRLKEKVLKHQGYHNFAFPDLVRLLEHLGFSCDRTSGSHQIFVHPDIPTPVNIQNVKGQAKPYQLRQIRAIIQKYKL